MSIFANEMALQQESFTTKAKKTGRRLIDGLFGNLASRQTQEREEELLTLLQEQQAEMAVQRAKAALYESACQHAIAPLKHLTETLQELMDSDDIAQHKRLYGIMLNDADEITEHLHQMIPPSLPPLPAIQTRKRYKVVIAMNNSKERQQLADMLVKDYDIHTCNNGWEALAEVYRSDIDMVVAHTSMTQVEGNTLCARMKANRESCHIPVILLTDNEEQRMMALQQGADAVLSTPTDNKVIELNIRNLLNAKRRIQMEYEQSKNKNNQTTGEEVKKTTNEKMKERVMNAIKKHLKDSNLSVDIIADEVGVSRAHLHRKMKELIGQTPHDVIRQLRLEQAAHLLATSDMNITEVVYACGFTNAASFSTTFKSIYGLTPSEYMAEKRKGTASSLANP